MQKAGDSLCGQGALPLASGTTMAEGGGRPGRQGVSADSDGSREPKRQNFRLLELPWLSPMPSGQALFCLGLHIRCLRVQ